MERVILERSGEIAKWLEEHQQPFFEALKIYGGRFSGWQQNARGLSIFRPGEFTGEGLCEDSSVLLRRAAMERFGSDLPLQIVWAEVQAANYDPQNRAELPFKTIKHAWVRGDGFFVDGVAGVIDPSLMGEIHIDSLENEQPFFRYNPNNPPREFTLDCEVQVDKNILFKPDGLKRAEAVVKALK